MNILITASTLPRWSGDTEPKFILEIAKNISLYRPENKIIIMAPHYRGAKHNEILEGINIIRYKYAFSRMEKLCYDGGMLENIKKNKLLLLLLPPFILSQIYNTYKIVKQENIDIIHSHWLIPQGFCAYLYKKYINHKIKIVCSTHGADVFSLKNKFFIYLKKIIINNIDATTAVSQELKNNLAKQTNNLDIEVISHGIDTNLFKPDKKSVYLAEKYKLKANTLLFVGRLAEKKGVKYLIQAMPKIISHHKDTKLLVVGGGPELSGLELLTKHLNLEKCVIFLGKIKNTELPIYYNLADIFVGPSIVAENKDTEGLGVVFLEALACGTPVIASDVGGISDVIIHQKTGLLVKPKNPVEISEAVIKLISTKNLGDALSSNGIALIKDKFHWPNIVLKYSNLYIKIV